MNVRSPKPWDRKNGVDMFLSGILYKFGMCMIGKSYCIVNLYSQTSQKLIVFAVSIKFCDESGLAILRMMDNVLFRMKEDIFYSEL